MKSKLLWILGIIVVIVFIGTMIFKTKENRGEENTLVLGLDDSFPPMGYRNENNEIVGFDIDVAEKVCEKLGYKLKLQTISWAAKEQELNSGNIDCIWNGFGITEEREQKMTLSEMYLGSNVVFLVNKDSDVQTQKDLEGKSIGVQTGSTQQNNIEKSEFGTKVKELIQYTDYLTALMDLDIGRLDGVYISEITANYLMKSQNKEYKVIKSENIKQGNGMVIAFKKGNFELRDKVQEALYELNEEGVLEEISNKWFGKDLTTVKRK